MIFDKDFEVERAVSKDPTRRALVNVMLDVAGKRLIAVDGYMLASVPCTPEASDHTGLVTPEALKAARKAVPRHGTPTLLWAVRMGHDAYSTVFGKVWTLAESAKRGPLVPMLGKDI